MGWVYGRLRISAVFLLSAAPLAPTPSSPSERPTTLRGSRRGGRRGPAPVPAAPPGLPLPLRRRSEELLHTSPLRLRPVGRQQRCSRSASRAGWRYPRWPPRAGARGVGGPHPQPAPRGPPPALNCLAEDAVHALAPMELYSAVWGSFSVSSSAPVAKLTGARGSRVRCLRHDALTRKHRRSAHRERRPGSPRPRPPANLRGRLSLLQRRSRPEG